MKAYVATQVRPGGLWHAGEHYNGGRARTLCGRWGAVDHLPDVQTGATYPMPAALDTGRGMQVIECIHCTRAVERAGAEWTKEAQA